LDFGGIFDFENDPVTAWLEIEPRVDSIKFQEDAAIIHVLPNSQAGLYNLTIWLEDSH
jgi:hypothetical protein